MSVIDFSSYINYLNSIEPTTQTVSLSEFIANAQVVGGEPLSNIQPNITTGNGGTIINISEYLQGETGGSTPIANVVELENYNPLTKEVTYTTGNLATSSIPWNTFVEGALTSVGLVCIGENFNLLCADIYNGIIADTFNKPHISEYDVENLFIQSAIDKNQVSYVDADTTQRLVQWLFNHYLEEPSIIENLEDITVGNPVTLGEGFEAFWTMVRQLAETRGYHDLIKYSGEALAKTKIYLNGYSHYTFAVNVNYASEYVFNIRGYNSDVEETIVTNKFFDIHNNEYATTTNILATSRLVQAVYNEITSEWEVTAGSETSINISPTVGIKFTSIDSVESSSCDYKDFSYDTNLFTVNPYSIVINYNNIPLEFPNWWENIREIPTINPAWVSNPSASPFVLRELLPFKWSPSADPLNDPNAQEEQQTGVNPYSYPYPNYDPYLNPQYEITPQPSSKIPVADSTIPPINDNPTIDYPSTPSPSPTPTPTPVIPPSIGGLASALFTVYNPTMVELNALGRTLWSENIITQLVQIFSNNPIEAVISLQVLYCTPVTNNSSNIILGYIDAGSDTNCPLVTQQYVDIDCGEVTIAEFYGDARDYTPFTKVSVYLPFIGFRDLKTEDIIGGKVKIKYTVDILTGTCLATITVTKKGISQVLYTFNGDCATNYPLTGADKSRMISSAVGVVAGLAIAGTAPTAMGALGGEIGAVKSVSNSGHMVTVSRSGNFTGNAGAMGIKKPYIIVNRDYAYDAENYNTLYGYPANITTTLYTCKGFTRVKEIHVDNIVNASSNEKNEIERLLKAGVIIR